MPRPKKSRIPANVREAAFNLRLSGELLTRLDKIIEGGPTVLSRNQFIQRVLQHFADKFDQEAREWNTLGGAPEAHIVAGYIDWMTQEKDTANGQAEA